MKLLQKLGHTVNKSTLQIEIFHLFLFLLTMYHFCGMFPGMFFNHLFMQLFIPIVILFTIL